MKNGLIEDADGDKAWYLNNQLHREDGPAIEFADGTKHWYLNGQIHREDGPATEFPDGTWEWHLNGQPHREDGPAAEFADGSKRWYLDGQILTPATEVTTINSKTENKPSPGDLVKDEIDNLRLITIVAGDPDQGYHIAFLK